MAAAHDAEEAAVPVVALVLAQALEPVGLLDRVVGHAERAAGAPARVAVAHGQGDVGLADAAGFDLAVRGAAEAFDGEFCPHCVRFRDLL